MENPLTPLRFLQRAASVHPDRTAIIDGPRTFTYAAMAAEVTRLANALRARGLQPGDRVAYLAPNCAEVLVGHFAVPLAGGVLVTINTRLSPEEIAAIIEHSGAVFLLADAPAGRAGPGEARRRHDPARDHHPAQPRAGGRRTGLHHRLPRTAGRRQRRTDRLRGGRRGRRRSA